MGRFTVRRTGQPELDRVQDAVKAAFDALGNAVAAVTISQSTTGALTPTGVVPGVYNNPTLTVNASGQLTLATDHSIGAGLVPYGAASGGALTASSSLAWSSSLQQLVVTTTSPASSSPQVGLAVNNPASSGSRSAAIEFRRNGVARAQVFGGGGSTGSFAGVFFPTIGGATDQLFTVNNQANVDVPLIVSVMGADVGIGSGNLLGTTAANGWAWLPSVNGPPTVAPAPLLGGSTLGSRTALGVDVVNGRLYGYLGGAWTNLTAAGSGITQLTGDVTAGPGSGSQAATIATNAVTTAKILNSAVTLAKIANIADQRVLGNVSGGAAAPAELTASQVSTLLGLAAIATSGSATDLIAGTLPAARFPALTGDVTTAAGALATTIASNAVTTAKILNSAVTYAKIQNVTNNRVLGNVSGGATAPSELTASDLSTLLALSTTYETQAHAAATYETIAHAAATYQPLLSLTNTRVLFATGASTVGTSSGFTFDSPTGQLRLGTPPSLPSIGATLRIDSAFNTGSGLSYGIYVQDSAVNGQANIRLDNWLLAGTGILAHGSDLVIGGESGGGGTGIIFKYGMSGVTGTGGTTVLAMDAITGAWTFGSSDVTVNGSLFAASANGGLRVDALGNVRLGKNASLVASATDGFPQMPNVAGRFTGTPTLPFTGGAPFGFDKNNNNVTVWSSLGSTWMVFPAFAASTAAAGVQVSTLTNLPAAVVSTTPKWEVITDAAGVTTYRPFWQ